MVHVCLDKLEGLILDHPNCFLVKHLLVFFKLLPWQTLTVLGGFERLVTNLLHIRKTTDSSTHAEAEISEPFVVKGDGPVFGEELNHIWNNTSCVSLSEGVQVVLVETNERPERLQHHLFTSHVGDGVNQADWVECKFDPVTLAGFNIQIIANNWITVLGFRLIADWVSCVDVIVDQVVWQDCSQSRWNVEQW